MSPFFGGSGRVLAVAAATGLAACSDGGLVMSDGPIGSDAPPSDGTLGGDPYSHRPSGYTTVISDYAFDESTYTVGDPPYYDTPSFDGSGWGLVNAGGLTHEVDPDAPVSPGNVMQWTFPPGLGGSGVGTFYRSVDAGITELYVAFSVWHDPNFEWNTISNKLFYWEDGNIILQSRHFGNYLSLYIGAYDVAYEPNAYVPQQSDFDGKWVNVEYIIQRGSPGRLAVWMNGDLVSDYAVDVPAIDAESSIKLDSTWGGGGERFRTSYRRVDHILVAAP